MDINKENELLQLASKLNWKKQSFLTKKEDELAKLKSPFIASLDESRNIKSIHRYICLGSIPYLLYDDREYAESRGQWILSDLWQYELLPMCYDLVNRPTMPTGNLDATYMFIGDAPGVGDGEIQDRFDRVFVYGPSSHMLRKALIIANIHYDSWYTNLLKLSTPNNRPSSHEEVLSHKYMLDKEIETINPGTIVLLGNHVNNMFSKHFSYKNKKIIKIYHPSYIIRKGMDVEWYSKAIESELL